MPAKASAPPRVRQRAVGGERTWQRSHCSSSGTRVPTARDHNGGPHGAVESAPPCVRRRSARHSPAMHRIPLPRSDRRLAEAMATDALRLGAAHRARARRARSGADGADRRGPRALDREAGRAARRPSRAIALSARAAGRAARRRDRGCHPRRIRSSSSAARPARARPRSCPKICLDGRARRARPDRPHAAAAHRRARGRRRASRRSSERRSARPSATRSASPITRGPTRTSS